MCEKQRLSLNVSRTLQSFIRENLVVNHAFKDFCNPARGYKTRTKNNCLSFLTCFMCLCTQGTTSLPTYPVHKQWKSVAKTKFKLGLIIRDVQTVSEMINAELAGKVVLYSPKNANRASFPDYRPGNFNETKKSSHTPLKKMGKQR